MMIKRRLYLIGINIALIVTVNVIMMILQQVFGVQLAPSSYQGLLVFSFVLGFGGALMNLWLSRWTAKRLYGVQLVDESVVDPKLQVVYRTVQEIAYRERITIPEV